jgi:hypothetical protein
MDLDYKAIQYQINVLEKNNIVVKAGEKYGVLYFISPYLEHNIGAFNEVKAAIDQKKAKKRKKAQSSRDDGNDDDNNDDGATARSGKK